MPRGGINKRGLKKLTDNIQKELDKNPVYVPVQAETPQRRPRTWTEVERGKPAVVHNYNGPVFQGTVAGAQLAWEVSGDVHQEQGRTESVTPGFEAIAKAVADVLQGLPTAALEEEEYADAEACAEEALEEVTHHEPDRSKLRRAVNAIKGFLLPVASRAAIGASDGAQEWAQRAISSLDVPF